MPSPCDSTACNRFGPAASLHASEEHPLKKIITLRNILDEDGAGCAGA
ncbi:hypothetical protein ACFLQZ_00290 [Acidobacteriota bacterium]